MRAPTLRATLLLSCLALSSPLVLAAGETTTLGAGVTVEETTPIHAILADPDAFLGKTVRIEGGVLDVCPMKGCWVEVGDENEGIRVKVEDDVIVFPADSKGKIIAAEGVVEAVEMSREQYVDWLEHLAEEKGEPFDPTQADLGDGPHRMIRIRGTGALVE